MQDRVVCDNCGKLSGFDDFVAGALKDGIHTREFMIHVIETGAQNSSPPHDLQCMSCGDYYKMGGSKNAGFSCLHPKTWSTGIAAAFECLHPKTWAADNATFECDHKKTWTGNKAMFECNHPKTWSKEKAMFECDHKKTWAKDKAMFECNHKKTWARVELESDSSSESD
jgi:hypothetical protein